jgi:hypothetical protein
VSVARELASSGGKLRPERRGVEPERRDWHDTIMFFYPLSMMSRASWIEGLQTICSAAWLSLLGLHCTTSF